MISVPDDFDQPRAVLKTVLRASCPLCLMTKIALDIAIENKGSKKL